jgi:hypothetical protein
MTQWHKWLHGMFQEINHEYFSCEFNNYVGNFIIQASFFFFLIETPDSMAESKTDVKKCDRQVVPRAQENAESLQLYHCDLAEPKQIIKQAGGKR